MNIKMTYAMYLEFCEKLGVKEVASETMFNELSAGLLKNEAYIGIKSFLDSLNDNETLVNDPLVVDITKAELTRLIENSTQSVSIAVASETAELTPESIVKISREDLVELKSNQKEPKLNTEVPQNLILLDEDNIGDRVVDRITGFAGVLTGVSYSEDNYYQGEVQPQCENPTKMPKSEWIEISRLELKNG